MTLHIGPRFDLPAEAVTETFGILAKRGVGKTYTAAVMVEEMIKAGLHVAVVDPIGVWWGLRSSADGKKPGLPVVIIGGAHGDVPLEETGGALVADLLVDSPTSVVIDLSLLRKGAARRFMTDFLEQLYHRNTEALHVVLDEADEWCPQRPQKGAERLLGACEDLVRRGRARGLGVTMITQRPAVIHKDVLTQIEVLVALRIVGPQDRAAIDEWVKVHGTPEQRQELIGGLAQLPVGTAWFWSPGWLDVFQKVQVRKRETFDSSATPKAGERRSEPKQLAEVDLEVLKQQMAATIERAQADDPKLLRRRIAELEKQVAAHEPETIIERVEVPVITDGQIERLQALASEIGYAVNPILDGISQLRAMPPPPPAARPPAPRRTLAAPARRSSVPTDGDTSLGKAERAVLTVLVQFPAGRTKQQIALLSGYSVKSSGLSNALGRLRSLGFATKGGALTQATPEGVEALGDVEPLPTGQALIDHWMGQLGKAERAVLEVMIDAYPHELTKQDVADRTGYSVASSGLSNALGRLRSLELVEGWRVADDLMGGA